MICNINPLIKNYPWGEKKNIVEDMFDVTLDTERISELWYGAYTNTESSRILDSGNSLYDSIDVRLSFLSKILFVKNNLSLQVHPKKSSLKYINGIDSDICRDGYEKNEVVYSLLDQSYIFAGFDSLENCNDVLCKLLISEKYLHIIHNLNPLVYKYFKYTIDQSRYLDISEMKVIIDFLLSLSASDDSRDLIFQLNKSFITTFSISSIKYKVLNDLFDKYQYDISISILAMMNFMMLPKNSYVSVPAGTLHMYLSGLFIEVMNNSDNTIRVGLTNKIINRDMVRKTVDYKFKHLEPLVDSKNTVISAYGIKFIYSDKIGNLRIDNKGRYILYRTTSSKIDTVINDIVYHLNSLNGLYISDSSYIRMHFLDSKKLTNPEYLLVGDSNIYAEIK